MDDGRRAELTALLDKFGIAAPASGWSDDAWALVDQALTHRSWRVENNAPGDNERLEFLGDAVIGLASTEYLFQSRPGESEGVLSKIKAAMVSRRILGEIALGLGVPQALRLGAGEANSGGRERLSNLGSALEALCGALYRSCPWENLRPALIRAVVEPAHAHAGKNLLVDYKSRLQEWTQKTSKTVPEYRVVGEEGPDHQRHFVVQVWAEGRLLATGRGSRIKTAENEAARLALDQIPEAGQ